MKLEEYVDYYIDERSGLMVLTAHFHEKRGYCCGNKCRECPYIENILENNVFIDNKTKTNE